MRFLCLFALLTLALPITAEEPRPNEPQPIDPRPFIVDEVPPEMPVATSVDRTCCGSEHLDHGDRYYSTPPQQGFDTRKSKELLEFRLLLTDSVTAPAPKPNPVTDVWDE